MFLRQFLLSRLDGPGLALKNGLLLFCCWSSAGGASGASFGAVSLEGFEAVGVSCLLYCGALGLGALVSTLPHKHRQVQSRKEAFLKVFAAKDSVKSALLLSLYIFVIIEVSRGHTSTAAFVKRHFILAVNAAQPAHSKR